MRSSELVRPLPMTRVAIVAPRKRLRDALVVVADTGVVELVGSLPAPEGEEAEALRRLERARPETTAQPVCLSVAAVDAGTLETAGARGLLAGEVELRRRAALVREHGRFAALVGWAPTRSLPELEERLTPVGAAVVSLPRPAWVDPPTLFKSTPVRRSFRPLVTTYGVAPYADVDPTSFAAVSFVVMFGMMFGDVGHGLVLAVLGLFLRGVKRGPLLPFRSLWLFPVHGRPGCRRLRAPLRRGVRSDRARAPALARPGRPARAPPRRRSRGRGALPLDQPCVSGSSTAGARRDP